MCNTLNPRHVGGPYFDQILTLLPLYLTLYFIDTSQKDADVYQQQNVFLFFSTLHSAFKAWILHKKKIHLTTYFLALHLMLIESHNKDREAYRFNSGGRRGNFSRARFQLSRHFFIHLKYLRQVSVT